MQAKIGITTWLRPLPTYLGKATQLYTLGLEYVRRVQAAGGLPLLLPHLAKAEEVLDLLDGLLLSGGGDVHPESYGEMHDGTSSDVSLEADTWEIALVRGARRRNLPVLGICRGMQIMAVALGGRLKQSIGGLPDHPALDSLSGEEILALRHPVTLQPGSRLASLYGQSEVLVNTIHHQAVQEAGQWQITGYGSGDLIEALEANDDWPALGVQWHPEKLVPGQEEHLFAYLIHEAENYARAKQPGTSKGEGA